MLLELFNIHHRREPKTLKPPVECKACLLYLYAKIHVHTELHIVTLTSGGCSYKKSKSTHRHRGRGRQCEAKRQRLGLCFSNKGTPEANRTWKRRGFPS